MEKRTATRLKEAAQDLQALGVIFDVLEAAQETGEKVSQEKLYEEHIKRLGVGSRQSMQDIMRRAEVLVSKSLFVSQRRSVNLVEGCGAEISNLREMSRVVARLGAKKTTAQHILRVAVPNIYELNVLTPLLPSFLKLERWKNTHVVVMETRNALEGIGLLWDGRVDVFLDSHASRPPELGGIKVDNLEVAWKRLVIFRRISLSAPPDHVPDAIVRLLKRGGDTIHVDALAEIPLCFVEFLRIAEDSLLGGATAPRVLMGTTEAVHRMVDTGSFAGISINWDKVLGPQCADRFEARFLETSPALPEFPMFLCHRNTGSKAAVASAFAKHIQSFFKQERANKIQMTVNSRRKWPAVLTTGDSPIFKSFDYLQQLKANRR